MLLLAEIAIILIVAKLAGELASRWDQPPVLGQLIAGLILGAGLSLVDNPALRASGSDLDTFANLGVVVLMFLAGLETDWDQLRATGRAAFVSASFGVAVPLAGGYGLGVLFGLPPLEALFVGVILTATSVSITAQTLMEMGSLQTVEGATVLGAAVIDDVIGLVVFSLVVALTGSSSTGTGGSAQPGVARRVPPGFLRGQCHGDAVADRAWPAVCRAPAGCRGHARPRPGHRIAVRRRRGGRGPGGHHRCVRGRATHQSAQHLSRDYGSHEGARVRFLRADFSGENRYGRTSGCTWTSVRLCRGDHSHGGRGENCRMRPGGAVVRIDELSKSDRRGGDDLAR